MKQIGLAAGALALLVAAGVSEAAAQYRNPRLVAKEAGRLMIPLCQLRLAGKVNDGVKQLRTGLEDKEAPRRAAGLTKAEQILLQDIGAGNDQDPAAWYYLGRTYLAQGDVVGADSAFSRVEGLQPDCELDIKQYRQNAWAELANAGIQFQQNGQSDSAMVLFREASTIFGGMPHVFENMGVLFATAGRDDSAVVYFEKALKVAEPDTSLVENRNSSAVNLAIVQQRLGKHQEAIVTLRQLLQWKPNDTEARRSIAFSFREMGKADSAEAIEQQLVAEFGKMNLDSLPVADVMAVGVSHFNNKQYAEAAQIFEKLVAGNPWNRDAVYNLTNAYLALENHEKIIATGRQLLVIEPLYEDAYRLVGQGYRGLKQQDSLVAVAERLVTLPVNVEVTLFSIRSDGVRWLATAKGRAAMDATGKPLPPAPVSVVVEFLDKDGKVVVTEEESIPALEPGKAHELKVEVKGEGITAWRYKRK